MSLTAAGTSGPPRWQRVLDAVPPPASGAVVMGSAILCVDLYSVGQPVLAAILLWFAAGTWLFLATVLALRARHEPGRFACEARSSAALTGVAGTGELGIVSDLEPPIRAVIGGECCAAVSAHNGVFWVMRVAYAGCSSVKAVRRNRRVCCHAAAHARALASGVPPWWNVIPGPGVCVVVAGR